MNAGWPIVAAGFVIMAVSGLVWQSFSLFLVALEREFGWSRATISAAYTLFTVVNAASSPLIGWCLRRWDSRVVLGVSSAILGAGFLMAARVTSPVDLYVAFGLVAGLGVQCCGTYALFTILANWFKRSAAPIMSIVDSGSGIGVFLGLPALHTLMLAVGWRGAYFWIGVLVLAVVLPLNAWLMRYAPPGGAGPEPPAAPAAAAGRRRLRPGILLLGAAFFLGPAAYHALLTQQVALLHDRGLEASVAVWIASATGLAVFLCRFVAGWLADRWGETAVMRLACVGATLAVAVLLAVVLGGHPTVLYVYPALVGLGFGAQVILLALGTRRLAPGPDFGVVYGFLRLVSGAGMALGPSLAAGVFDLTGSYAIALVLIIGATVGQYLAFRGALGRGASGVS